LSSLSKNKYTGLLYEVDRKSAMQVSDFSERNWTDNYKFVKQEFIQHPVAEEGLLSKVSIVRCDSYESSKEGIKKAVDYLGGLGRFIRTGDVVWLKPNLGRTLPTVPSITDPRFLASLIQLIKEETKPKKIIVADSPVVGYTGERAFNDKDYSGLPVKPVVEKAGAEVLYLDEAEHEPIKIAKAVVLKDVLMPKLRREVDVIINVPKLKTHVQTGITVCVKNWHGMIHWDYRRIFHSDDLPQKLIDIFKADRAMPDLNIVDGIVATHEFGPTIAGLPYDAKVILAGTDPIACDAVCAYMMGWDDLAEIDTVRIGEADGIGVGKLDQIEVLGEPLRKLEGFKRPNLRLVAEYPGVNIILGSVCAGCRSRLKFALENLKKRNMLKPYLEKYGDLTLVCGIGARLPEPSENVIYLGDCLQYDIYFPAGGTGNPRLDTNSQKRLEILRKGVWIQGCPIWFTDVSDLIKKRLEK